MLSYFSLLGDEQACVSIFYSQLLSLKKRVQAVYAGKLLVYLKMPKLRNTSLFLFKNGEVCRLVGKFSD